MGNQLEDFNKLIQTEGIKRSNFLLGKGRKIAEISDYIKKRFKDTGREESLVIFLRRHWINLFFQLLPFVALIFVLFLSYFFFFFFLGSKILNPIEWQFIQLGMALFSLFLWSFIFVVFIDYYLDVWIVTNERIVNIEQKGLFRREISELRLENVQDLTTEISGVIETFFDFGNLYIQTAGKRERFLFKSIPHPERVRDIILVLSEEEEKEA